MEDRLSDIVMAYMKKRKGFKQAKRKVIKMELCGIYLAVLLIKSISYFISPYFLSWSIMVPSVRVMRRTMKLGLSSSPTSSNQSKIFLNFISAFFHP